jgi:hypothetical protein
MRVVLLSALLLLHPRPAQAAVFSIPLTAAPNSALPHYLALVGIGSPPQVRALALDTGSSLAFTSCVGCVGCPAGRTLFDPSASSTARRVPCGDALCNAHVCGPNQLCPVSQSYAEGSSISGTLLTDAFFGAQKPAAPPLLPFACIVHENGVFSAAAEDGVLGLSPARAYNGTFLPALLAAGVLDSSAFTLCLAPQGTPSTLLLGAALSGGADFAWAPLATQTFFFAPTVTDLLLEGRGVCEGKPCPGLNAPHAIIDTGSYTYVPSAAYSSLLSSAQAWCEAAPAERCIGTRAYMPGEALCYNTLQPATFPTATFTLLPVAGDPAVSITFPVFASRPWADLCLSVYDNGSGGTVIGINALANKTLVFDLEGWRLGVGADTGVCAEPPSASASASASPAGTPTPMPTLSPSPSPSPSPSTSPSLAPTEARTVSCTSKASAAPVPTPPAARDGVLAPGAVAALCALGAAAACGLGAAGLQWRAALRRSSSKGPGSGQGGSDVVMRPNPASAASRRLVAGDLLSLWQTSAEGGAGSAAAAARAEALREVLLLRGDDPLPPRPSEI